MIDAPILKAPDEHRTQWLQQRKSIIGASEIAALCGLNAYASPMDVWLAKTTDLPDEDNEFLKAGRMLEPVILRWYADEHRCVVQPNRELFVHPAHSFIGATPDGFIHDYVIDGDALAGAVGLVEAKNTSKYIDDVQKAHYVQLQYQLGVTGLSYGSVAYLVQGHRFLTFTFERNDLLVDQLFELAEDFWTKYVETRTPPPAERPGDSVKAFPTSSPALVRQLEGTPEIAELVERAALEFKELQQSEKRIKADIAERREFLQSVMANASILQIGDRVLATWKNDKPSQRFDEKAFASAHPDLYEMFMREHRGARRFTVKA